MPKTTIKIAFKKSTIVKMVGILVFAIITFILILSQKIQPITTINLVSTSTTEQPRTSTSLESNIETTEIPFALDFSSNVIYFPNKYKGMIKESNIGQPIDSFLYQGWKITYQDYSEMQETNQRISLQTINGMYQSAISNSISVHPATDELIYDGSRMFLKVLNDERAKYNLSTLILDYSFIAQNRSNDMINRNYFSHVTPPPFIQNWNYGSPPNLVYTQFGGQYIIGENIIERYCPKKSNCLYIVNKTDLENYVKNDVYSFIYEDSGSNWGHRDSLLNPCFNYVSIGLNWTDDQYRLTSTMEGKWIKWERPPTYDNALFLASGYIDPRFTIDPNSDVQIFYVSPEQVALMMHSYSVGDFYAGLTEPDYFYPGGRSIYTTFTYDSKTGYFNLGFRFDADKTGVYTIVMFATDNYAIRHPFIPNLKYTCAIFEYSIPYVAQ